jgi:alpha-tubulin suppressor-like RCC1 family protein
VATVDLGKIKFTWTGAYNNSTVYQADDVASNGGSSWVCILDFTVEAFDINNLYSQGDLSYGQSDGNIYVYYASSPATGQVPESSASYWRLAEPSSDTGNSTYWELMVEGTNPLTTQGDIMTHDGSNAIRLARGQSGEVLKVSGSDLAFGTEQGFVGHKHLKSNYGAEPANPGASTTYGANGKYNWLADYANNWIPEDGTPNPACGPVKNSDRGVQHNGYRMTAYLNENHELVAFGDDDLFWMGSSGGQTHTGGVVQNISVENGGMRDGDYFVRLWVVYRNVFLLTKDGDLFTAGDNAYGQLGTGGTTDRYMLAKVSTLGPDATHNGTSCQIAGFHVGNQTNSSGPIEYHSCYAIDTSGRLFVWGYNGSGKLGIGNATNQSYPVLASAVSNVVSVSAGMFSAHCITSTGDLYRTGADQNGVNQGSATTTWTDTTQGDAYQVCNVDGYYGASTVYAFAMYLNTSGELYGIGGNAIGQLGDGTLSDKSAWTRAGGSTTFSSFYCAGNSYYNTVASLGGTPGNSDDTIYMHGYNVGGQCGVGTVVNVQSPTQPQTTSLFSHTVSSTSSDSAPTKTDIAFPRTAIKHVYPLDGIPGQGSQCHILEDEYGRLWRAGYGNNLDYHESTTANATNSNFFLDPSPFNATGTITGTHWTGEAVCTVEAIYATGNHYASEGNHIMVTSDGRIWGRGYNSQGQLSDGGLNFIGQWKQMTP